MPSVELSIEAVTGVRVLDVAAASGLCRSKSDARRLVESGGLYLNNARVDGIDAEVTAQDVIDGRLLIFRSGKKNYRLVKVQ